MSTRNSNGKKLNEKRQRHPDGPVEHWRDVPGFEGYYRVSDWGRVKSLDRKFISFSAKAGRFVEVTWKGRILLAKAARDTHYDEVTLCKGAKIRRKVKIHLLVLEVFVGPYPEGMEACHNDDNKRNNRLSNLRYDTHVNNCKDRTTHGNSIAGNTVLADPAKEIPEIHRLYNEGWTVHQLADRFGGSIYSILLGQAYRRYQPEKKDRAVMRRSGRIGRNHHKAKLTEADIPLILAALKTGRTQSDVANEYGVSQGIISSVFLGLSWRHVKR